MLVEKVGLSFSLIKIKPNPMKYLALLIIPILLLSCDPPENTPEESSSTTVMAYYVPKDNSMPEDLPLEQLTHIIYSFTHVIDGEMAFRNEEKA